MVRSTPLTIFLSALNVFVVIEIVNSWSDASNHLVNAIIVDVESETNRFNKSLSNVWAFSSLQFFSFVFFFHSFVWLKTANGAHNHVEKSPELCEAFVDNVDEWIHRMIEHFEIRMKIYRSNWCDGDHLEPSMDMAAHINRIVCVKIFRMNVVTQPTMNWTKRTRSIGAKSNERSQRPHQINASEIL